MAISHSPEESLEALRMLFTLGGTYFGMSLYEKSPEFLEFVIASGNKNKINSPQKGEMLSRAIFLLKQASKKKYRICGWT